MQEKSLKQIADELNVDKQRVYRFVKKNNIDSTSKGTSKMYYDVKAQKRIKAYFNALKSSAQNDCASNCTENNAQFDALLHQLELKDKQIDDLTRLLDQEQKLNAIHVNRIAELEDKSQQTSKKRRFFQRNK